MIIKKNPHTIQNPVYNGLISGLFVSFYGKNMVKKGEKQCFFIVF